MDIGLEVSKTNPVHFFSVEMNFQQLQLRALSNLSGINHHRLCNFDTSLAEKETLNEVVADLQQRQLFIDEESNTLYPINVLHTHKAIREKYGDKMPPNSINAGIEQAINLGCKLIIVDYLQILNCGIWTERNDIRIHQITWTLSQYAKKYQIPIILVSQLRRFEQSRYKNNKAPRPRLDDLRDSGAIEQDSNIVILLHRPQHYETDKELDLFTNTVENDAELIIAKNRSGKTGTVKLAWHGSIMSFRNLKGE